MCLLSKSTVLFCHLTSLLCFLSSTPLSTCSFSLSLFSIFFFFFSLSFPFFSFLSPFSSLLSLSLFTDAVRSLGHFSSRRFVRSREEGGEKEREKILNNERVEHVENIRSFLISASIHLLFLLSLLLMLFQAPAVLGLLSSTPTRCPRWSGRCSGLSSG